MSTHNICFHGEIRKIYQYFWIKKSILSRTTGYVKVRFHSRKTGLSTPLVFLLTVTRRFLCCSSSLFVPLWFHM